MDTNWGALVASYLDGQNVANFEEYVVDGCSRALGCKRSVIMKATCSQKSMWNLRSRAFRHAWNTFMRNRCRSFLANLLELLPAAVKGETMELLKGLGLSTNSRQRPSFENIYARSGYIQQKINCCINLPNLLFTEELSELRSEIFRGKQSK